MHSIVDVEAFLFKLLGPRATRQFDSSMEEFTFFVKAEALTNSTKTENEMRKLAKETCEKILSQSVKTYLSDNFSDEKGELRLKVDNGMVYDKDMKPVKAISVIRENMPKICEVIVENVMMKFLAGRKIAQGIVERITSHKDEELPSEKPCPYEFLEAERMRLERKLPNIKPQEAKRLCHLYGILGESHA